MFVSRQEGAALVRELAGPEQLITYSAFRQWWKQSTYAQTVWSAEELEDLKAIRAKFVLLDSDRDGLLSEEQFAKFHSELLAEGYDLPALENCKETTFNGFVGLWREHVRRPKQEQQEQKQQPKQAEERKKKTAADFRVLNETSTYHMLKMFRAFDKNKANCCSLFH